MYVKQRLITASNISALLKIKTTIDKLQRVIQISAKCVAVHVSLKHGVCRIESRYTEYICVCMCYIRANILTSCF